MFIGVSKFELLELILMLDLDPQYLKQYNGKVTELKFWFVSAKLIWTKENRRDFKLEAVIFLYPTHLFVAKLK